MLANYVNIANFHKLNFKNKIFYFLKIIKLIFFRQHDFQTVYSRAEPQYRAHSNPDPHHSLAPHALKIPKLDSHHPRERKNEQGPHESPRHVNEICDVGELRRQKTQPANHDQTDQRVGEGVVDVEFEPADDQFLGGVGDEPDRSVNHRQVQNLPDLKKYVILVGRVSA